MSRVKDFFNSHWFDSHWKTRVHIGMMVLIVAVIALTGARVATKPKGTRTTRSDTLGITMAVKSIVFLIYQLLTDKVDRFRKWRSLKAYTILNTMEIVFWFVVVIMTFMGISRFCQGTNCAFAWFVALNGFLLMATSFWAAVICWKDHKYFKSTGVVRGTALPTHATSNSPYSSQSAMK
ncbi:hypothetical protein CEP54_004517 [Fusarium duplospermum]|uniref:MARVEL domain-containing protein n=1 Tax=Fusarium duplospermum TaxID=1325734 RepID=A0A428QHP1_9HYPO|nr:hypothetical protein CEP54_004517 [Fusarium duplospermum]